MRTLWLSFLVLANASIANAVSVCDEIQAATTKSGAKPYKVRAMKTWTLPVLSQNSTLCRTNGGCIIAADPEAAKSNLSKGTIHMYSIPSGKPKEVNLESGAPTDDCLNGSADGKNCYDACKSVALPRSSKIRAGQVVFIPGLKGKTCGGKVHDGCVIVSESIGHPDEANLFLGRCRKIGRHDGLCNDDDIVKDERPINGIKSGLEIFAAPEELATKYAREAQLERKALVEKAYKNLPATKPGAPIPVMPAATPPEAGR